MSGVTRIVERLHLRADSESAVRRALPCLEDAFRTATLPDAGARLIFVRRLHLGTLPRRASAQSLSLAIESRFSEADWELVHAGTAGAAGAKAVWFRDALEAHELAALRAAVGHPLDAWFWRLAVPALAHAPSRMDTLRAIAFSLAATDEAPAALPVWTSTMVRTGNVEQLLAALAPGAGTSLFRAAGVTIPRAAGTMVPGSDPARPSVVGGSPSPALHARSGSASWQASLGPADDRVAFIEQMLILTPWHPVRMVTEESGEESSARRATLFSAGAPPASLLDGTAAARSEQKPRASTTGTGRLDSPTQSRSLTTPDNIAAARATSDRRLDTRSSQPRAELGETRAQRAGSPESNVRPDASRSGWPFVDAQCTRAGGLFFLVPVLERLGFREWCATLEPPLAAPDTLARQIFHVLLSRLRVAEDDPAWSIATPHRGFVASTAPARCLVASAFRRKDPSRVPEIWLSAC